MAYKFEKMKYFIEKLQKIKKMTSHLLDFIALPL